MRTLHKFDGPDSSSELVERNTDHSGPVADGAEQDTPVRALNSGEILFQAGDPKTHAYLVETGVICVYEPQWNGHRAVIEFAYPGDVVGAGFLERHSSSARATVETRLTCLPLSAVAGNAEGNSRAEARLTQAIDREFESLRDLYVSSGQRNPTERVAALLIALSHGNKYEGRDPNIITDSLQCGVAADCLSIDVPLMASILVRLEKLGLIEPCPPAGIRINDISALEKLAGEGIEPLAPRFGPNPSFPEFDGAIPITRAPVPGGLASRVLEYQVQSSHA